MSSAQQSKPIRIEFELISSGQKKALKKIWSFSQKRWSELREYGNSKVLRTSYAWLILVPVFVKLIENIERPLTINIFGTEIETNLSLPFHWELFFYAAVSASVANLIYVISCPSFLKKYGTYSEFSEAGRTIVGLKDEYARLIRNYYNQIGLKSFNNNLSTLGEKFNLVVTTFQAIDNKFPVGAATSAIRNLEIPEMSAPDLFENIYSVADTINRRRRRICYFAYMLAFSLLAIIVVQNTIYVINYSIEERNMDKWVVFTGHVYFEADQAVLKYSKHDDTWLKIDSDNVRVENGVFRVKQGAKIVSKNITTKTPLIIDESANSGSMCFDGIETSCDSNDVIGPCIGEWNNCN